MMHHKCDGSLVQTKCGLTVGDWTSDWEKADCPACLALRVIEPPRVGSNAWMATIMDLVFEECRALRAAGQLEYAHRDENALANFDRVAERLGMSREAVLMVYLEKHIDAVHSYIQGHKSQRESVRGRINDVIVYMCLLRGMVDQSGA